MVANIGSSLGLVGLWVLLAGVSPASAAAYTFTTFDAPGACNICGGTGPNGINDRGQIVGTVGDSTGLHGFLKTDGNFTQINVPGAHITQGGGINNVGQTVGDFFDNNNLVHGFLYGGGSFSILNVPGALETAVSDINDSGEMVGVFATSLVSSGVGFLYTGGGFTNFAVPGAYSSSPTGINNVGQIVGNYFLTPGSLEQSFLYSQGGFTAINIPGARIVGAQGINDLGQIVGFFIDGGPHGFVDTGGNFTTIDIPDSINTNVTDINNSGEIVGYWEDSTGFVHGFVGVPVPEPLDLVPFSVGLIGLGIIGRKKARHRMRIPIPTAEDQEVAFGMPEADGGTGNASLSLIGRNYWREGPPAVIGRATSASPRTHPR